MAGRRAQRGQAIVLIAIMLAVVVGMAALAIDGSRAYALRRDLQAAVDGAALAAADNFQQTGSYVSAEQAATANFGANARLYNSPSCAPAYGSPGASPFTVTCTYSEGAVLTQVVSALGAAGSQFAITGSRSLALQFARILTNGTTPRLSATSSGGVNNLLYAPTIAALNQAGCGGAGGSAVTVNGSGSLILSGDLVANGAITVEAGSLNVAGDVYARCQSSVAGSTTSCYPSGASGPCTFPDVIGATKSGYRLADPKYPPPPVVGGGQPSPGVNIVLSPGTYAANPNFGARRCYFLSSGVYKWPAGYSNNGGLVSNELKPPDEPLATDNTRLAAVQFWNSDGANCAGSFQVTATPGGGTPVGTWGLELTSVRTDTYSGSSYLRESAPSRCQSLTVHSLATITLQVSNVPGATSYNIYASPNACSGPFGLVFNLPVSGAVQNTDTSGCPFGSGGTCTLGGEATLPVLGLAFSSFPPPNMFAPPGTIGAYPPDSETAPMAAGLPNQNPDRATAPAGDRANENQCDTVGGVLTTCAGPITPGGVAFYIPSGGCLADPNGGDNYVFSGYQFNWMAIYEPGQNNPPANTCANVMGASTSSAFIGLVYVPAASINIPTSSGFRVEATGGVIADTITFTGQLPSISGSSAYTPVPPAARLTG
ncbi:MAG: hypothetical protein E6I95_07430 [Chloroflexi bacterium]|nr:MAG: hypothetical protein E6I95_07430 [Chloroflexota bacterium]